jgi:hypothetical protein
MSEHKRQVAPMQIAVMARPRSVLRWWIALTVILACLSTAEFFIRWHFQESFSSSEMLFYLDSEGNLPTWVQAGGLLLNGILAALIARVRRSDGTATVYWVLAAVGFTYMSADELCQYHERLTEPIWTWLQAEHVTMGGYLRNAWVVPALLLLPVVVFILLPFLRALSAGNRRRFVTAAIVYLFGAVVMDMISARSFFEAGDAFSMPYLVEGTIEESMESVGMGLFLYAFLVYLGEQKVALQFRQDGS